MYEAFHGTDKLQPAPHTLLVVMRQLTDTARHRLHCVTLLRAASDGRRCVWSLSWPTEERKSVERPLAETTVSMDPTCRAIYDTKHTCAQRSGPCGKLAM